MTFVPRHRRKRHPLDRQVLGTYKPPPANMPDCRCTHPWRAHVPKGMDERTYCNNARCQCLGYRPVAASTGGDSTDG